MMPALDGGDWSTPRPVALTPRKRPTTHGTGGWLSSRVCLDDAENLEHRTVQSVASHCLVPVMPKYISPKNTHFNYPHELGHFSVTRLVKCSLFTIKMLIVNRV